MVHCSEKGKTQLFLLFTYTSLWWWWCTGTSINVRAAENTDSMKPGDKLNAISKLCSKQHSYCMSFDHDPDRENLTYLSIFGEGRDTWLVWIANRNQPADKNSAVLSLDYSGVLKIESKIGEPIILYSSPQPFNNSTIVATLLDTGNFVLKDIQKNIVLWQSFDHPTDSLLPRMKLGVNHKTGQNWSLLSRISDTIHAPGPFRLELGTQHKRIGHQA
ncbi:putative non-specific serine/threonine protein kinase [Medicago truncatula]|uniref:Putative non-specific serine/threonine protein kinase n=1 Tax=Medicago truncatula TaxID=3880 RepID=A0A396GPT9_MEDTR|nr:putative non-specific serine/threonine protein kinase [Medicago truncatula]